MATIEQQHTKQHRTRKQQPATTTQTDRATSPQPNPAAPDERTGSPTAATTAGPDLRVVPISAVSVRDGFNPRTQRDDEAYGRTASSVRESGVLAPILVTPTGPGADTFHLVAGEGRYRAAVDAGHPEIPVLVREVDERTGGLELALVENLAREELDSVAVARGFDRLKRVGWSRRQIAETVSVTQKLVTERLQILQLPESLHRQIAAGQVPLSAVRPLAKLAQIHHGLPEALVARVLKGKPATEWEEPLDWPTVVADPIAALTHRYTGPGTDLPQGVYDAGQDYLAKDLPLSDKALEDLRALATLRQVDPDTAALRFSREGLEQARALKAAFASEHGYAHLVVGDDVVGQLFGDQLAAQLNQARRDDRERRRREKDRAREATDGASGSTGGADAAPVSEEEQAEARRRERGQRLEEQRQARAYNAELGAAVLRHLVRVKIEPRVLRVLVAAQPLDDLGGLALRGARYALPGWQTEETSVAGKTKLVFPDRHESRRKALAFLDGASTVGEISGRLLSLIVLARYADERAVAMSSRAPYAVPDPDGLPWETSVVDLIDEIALERLPEHLTERVREDRRAIREAEQRERREFDAALKRLEGIDERLPDLDEQQRAEALRDAQRAYGPYAPEVWDLRQKLRTAQETSADEPEGSIEETALTRDEQSDPVAAPAGDEPTGTGEESDGVGADHPSPGPADSITDEARATDEDRDTGRADLPPAAA